MKILVAHNYYQQPGGEDQVFVAESSLLESFGHQVIHYTAHNDQINRASFSLALSTIWNQKSYKRLKKFFQKESPDVVHFHNTFPLISPAAYYAARAHNIPIVQTLHNFRLLCPGALLLYDGRVCERCLETTFPWPALLRSCYRNSFIATACLSATLTIHRILGTWRRMVDIYIALTEFSRKKTIEGGLPAKKIVVKPNFCYTDPGQGQGQGNYALFVGRLSQEKGVDVLLDAWARLDHTFPLKIIGSGPLTAKIKTHCALNGNIHFIGLRTREEVLQFMKNASLLIFPSLWYEGFPMVIVEAFATGLPVVGSGHGSMASLIDHGRTGLHFKPNSPADLARQITWAWEHEKEIQEMRGEARREYEQKYTAERNYGILIEIYKRAVRNKKANWQNP